MPSEPKADWEKEAREEWRPVPGFAGMYDVSNLGRVRTLRTKPPRIMIPSVCRGYLRVFLTVSPGRTRNYSSHCLVLAAFVGPRPDGYQGAHMDGDRRNNKLTNLAWVTPLENCSHKAAHGTLLRGEGVGNSKLTAAQILDIRTLVHMSSKALAAKHGVHPGHVRNIRSGRFWNHVNPDASRVGGKETK